MRTVQTVLVSFDIDGTLESGDPPGPVAMALVRRAKTLGYLVGSCSDRTLREQAQMWAQHAIVADFVSLKHELNALRGRIGEARFIHIGDSTVDEHYARLAGFEFWNVHELPSEGADGWIF
jgi:predicted mannosyl-3-phosphoglycerate phosphatase (HAD superfamily)